MKRVHVAFLLLLAFGEAGAQTTYNFSTLDFPGAPFTAAYGINSGGQVVGQYLDTFSRSHSWLYSSGGFSEIAIPGALSSGASAINDLGDIVGAYTSGDGVVHGYLLKGGVLTTIDHPGSSFANAFGINNKGQIVGMYRDRSSMFHGFLLSSGVFSDIDFPGSPNSEAHGINDQGHIAGFFYQCGGCGGGHGFTFDGVTYQGVDVPASSGSLLFGINNSMVAAGFYSALVSPSVSQGFLYSGGQFTTINHPKATTSLPGSGTQALGINSLGQVVGVYVDASNLRHGYVATPAAPSINLLYDPTKLVKTGPTFPFSLQLFGPTGTNVSSPSTTLHAASISTAAGAVVFTYDKPGRINPEWNFLYDPAIGGTGGYSLNLRTPALPNGKYNLNIMVLGQPGTFSAAFSVH